MVSSLGLGTHPDAVSFWIWSQATATPRPLGDDLPPWFNNHEIYHAPSPKFDWLLEPIGKHNGTLPYDTITLSTGLYGYRRVNDGFIEAQPSGIGGIYEEDSTMYFEYESGILRVPGARGLCTAALNVYASNAESPQCGKTRSRARAIA